MSKKWLEEQARIAIQEAIDSYTIIIDVSRVDPLPTYFNGTATFIQFKKRKFVLSAGHVISHACPKDKIYCLYRHEKSKWLDIRKMRKEIRRLTKDPRVHKTYRPLRNRTLTDQLCNRLLHKHLG